MAYHLKPTAYRLYWGETFDEIPNCGWLEDAISKSSLPRRKPRAAYFLSEGDWIPVTAAAIDRAFHSAQEAA